MCKMENEKKAETEWWVQTRREHMGMYRLVADLETLEWMCKHNHKQCIVDTPTPGRSSRPTKYSHFRATYMFLCISHQYLHVPNLHRTRTCRDSAHRPSRRTATTTKQNKHGGLGQPGRLSGMPGMGGPLSGARTT